jgi:hypothetical protein
LNLWILGLKTEKEGLGNLLALASVSRRSESPHGTSPRTLDYFRTPWRPVFSGSLFREIHPFENRKRYFQLLGEFFNLINHTWFSWNQNSSLNMFSGDPPNLGPLSNPNNINYAGPIPYYHGRAASLKQCH